MSDVVIFGDTAPQFGLVDEAALGHVQAFNQKRAYDEAVAENFEGSVIRASYYNPRREGSITLVKRTGGTLPTVAAAATLANLLVITKAIITEEDRQPEQKGYTKYVYAWKAWDGVTLT